jgi:hypothetical protein
VQAVLQVQQARRLLSLLLASIYCDNHFIIIFIQSFDYCFDRYKIEHAAKGYGVKKPLWRPQNSPNPTTQIKYKRKGMQCRTKMDNR